MAICFCCSQMMLSRLERTNCCKRIPVGTGSSGASNRVTQPMASQISSAAQVLPEPAGSASIKLSVNENLHVFSLKLSPLGLDRPRRVIPAGPLEASFTCGDRIGDQPICYLSHKWLSRRNVPNVVNCGLTPARQEARRILSEVARGADPVAGKIAGRTAITIAELCGAIPRRRRSWSAADPSGIAKTESTLIADRGRIARHIVPLLGRMPVKTVRRDDVERFMHDVAAGKTAVREKTKPRGLIVRGGRFCEARSIALQQHIQPRLERL